MNLRLINIILLNNKMQQFMSYKYRLYPTKSQAELLTKNFGCKRWIFNHFLALNKESYETKEKHLNCYDVNVAITRLKKEAETVWLKEADSIALQNASQDLHNAYSNFFSSVTGKRRGPKVGLPSFKSRHSKQTYRTNCHRVEDGKLFIPKFKEGIEMVEHRPLPVDAKIKTVTISKTKTNKYFASILVETDIALKPMTDLSVGIDIGLKDLLILSTGQKFSNPRFLTKTKERLGRAQRQLSRKKKGSKNRERVRLKVAKLHEKVTNQRNDYYHNLSRYLVDNFDTICLETLNVKGMVKNHCLAGAISDASWSTLVSMIEYKASWAGKTVQKIDRWFPSSKRCSRCGEKKHDLTLDVREWTCSHCGAEHDRDLNASQNILIEGFKNLYGTFPSNKGSGVKIPKALMKWSSKIERSGMFQFDQGRSKPECL